MTIFVGPDTRRDLVFSRDAAALSMRLGETAVEPLTVSLVVDGTTRTIAEILSVAGSVSVAACRPPTPSGPTCACTRRCCGSRARNKGPDVVRRTPMETAVHLMLRVPLAA